MCQGFRSREGRAQGCGAGSDGFKLHIGVRVGSVDFSCASGVRVVTSIFASVDGDGWGRLRFVVLVRCVVGRFRGGGEVIVGSGGNCAGTGCDVAGCWDAVVRVRHFYFHRMRVWKSRTAGYLIVG